MENYKTHFQLLTFLCTILFEKYLL